MLVLTRKKQERIQIGDSVTITVVRIKGNTVRVGIEAPKDVRVVRGELVKENASGSDCLEIEATETTVANSEEEAAEGTADGLGVLPADRGGAPEGPGMSPERLGSMAAHAV